MSRYKTLSALFLSGTILAPACAADTTIPIPDVHPPLPVIQYMGNNGNMTKKFDIRQNPLPYILRGFNKVWTVGEKGWQENANSTGPKDFSHVRIVSPEVWRANIRYVMKVTRHRTDTQAVRAWLDDVRSKNYSVIDGLGPLTQLYVQASGAYTTMPPLLVKDVTENPHYDGGHDDGSEFAGRKSSVLGDVVMLTKAMRYTIKSATHDGSGTSGGRILAGMDTAVSSDAARYLQTLSFAIPSSTSGAKYIFASPRPWRMNPDGELHFTGPKAHLCISPSGGKTFRIYDSYVSQVKVVPALLCNRKTRSDIAVPGHDDRGEDGGFPSGHTNAAYLEAIALAVAVPERFQEMLIRAAQFGENRIIAGMHSPVDVIGGRISATAIAAYALNRPNVHALAQAAHRRAESYFGHMAKVNGESLMEFAHRKVTRPVPVAENGIVNVDVENNNLYADTPAHKKLYRARMTYGFPRIGKAGKAPVVPAGAEALLETRQPYLTADQRRIVLATTELSSGYPIIEGSNGWGRLDLVRAADGFGAFPTHITVDMNASLGGFNAADIWKNPISGPGGLTKTGSGKLTLTAENSYSGDTVLKAGTLIAGTPHAFGHGTLRVEGGTLNLTPTKPLLVKDCVLTGGTLQITLHEISPQETQITILKADHITGRFSSLKTEGAKLHLRYLPDRIIAVISHS